VVANKIPRGAGTPAGRGGDEDDTILQSNVVRISLEPVATFFTPVRCLRFCRRHLKPQPHMDEHVDVKGTKYTWR